MLIHSSGGERGGSTSVERSFFNDPLASRACCSKELKLLVSIFGSSAQGLTLVNLSAQRKRFLWNRGCIRGSLGIISRYQGE